MAGGYRAQRLYTLAGVTYNEWIGLRADEEAENLAWIMEHHEARPPVLSGHAASLSPH